MSTYKENSAIIHMLIKAETLVTHFLTTASELVTKITSLYVDDFEQRPSFGKYLIDTYEKDYEELNVDELFKMLLLNAKTDELKETIEAFFLCREHSNYVLNFFYNFYLEGEENLGFEDEYVNDKETVDKLSDYAEDVYVNLFGTILKDVYEAKFGGARC